MPQKNIYIRDADKQLWDEAEEAAGSASFSQLITDILRDYVAQVRRIKEAQSMGTETIEFEIENEKTGRISKKSFKGRWVIDTNDDLYPDGWDLNCGVLAGITAKGKIFVGSFRKDDGDHLKEYKVYDSVEDAERGGEPAEVLAAVAEEVGEDYVQELDI